MFKYSLDNKRCPNKKNSTGCIYCLNGSGENEGMDLVKQFGKVKKIMSNKWNTNKYIGYFQAKTNTYAPVEVLKEKYEIILNQPNVIGLNIATRCDALPEDVLNYLEELNKKTDLTIELGLQTIHESTSKLINRGHTLECFTNAVNELRKRKIDVVVHIINGLPFETKEMMLETVRFLSKLDIQGIKIHMLFIEKGTELETKVTIIDDLQIKTTTYVQATESVNIRTDATAESNSLGVLEEGQKLEGVRLLDNGWYEVNYNGKNAYINGDYVKEIQEEKIISPFNKIVMFDHESDIYSYNDKNEVIDTVPKYEVAYVYGEEGEFK